MMMMMMMMKIVKTIMMLVFGTVIVSCKTTENEPSQFLNISPKELIFWPEASQRQITASASGTLTAMSDASWCTVDIFASSSNNVSVSVSANDVVDERKAQVTVSNGELSEYVAVTQLGIAPAILFDETRIFLNYPDESNFTLEVNSNVPFVFELPEWISENAGNNTIVGQKTYSFHAAQLPQDVETRTENLVMKSIEHGISASIPVTQSLGVSTIRIASYNIWNERGADWQNFRREILNNLIRQHDFDIMGSQEGFLNPHLNSLIADGTYAYTGVGRDDGINGGEHSAIVYKKERFELLESGDFWYSETPQIPSYGWGASYRRICSWAKFRDKESGRQFYVFSSHLDHQVAVARFESVKLMLVKIREIAGENATIFSVGDFNSQPGADPIRYILNDGLFKDSFDITETPRTGSIGTMNSRNTNNPTSRIDYVFVTSNVRVLEYGVINDRPDGQYPSDHDPVLVVAEF